MCKHPRTPCAVLAIPPAPWPRPAHLTVKLTVLLWQCWPIASRSGPVREALQDLRLGCSKSTSQHSGQRLGDMFSWQTITQIPTVLKSIYYLPSCICFKHSDSAVGEQMPESTGRRMRTRLWMPWLSYHEPEVLREAAAPAGHLPRGSAARPKPSLFLSADVLQHLTDNTEQLHQLAEVIQLRGDSAGLPQGGPRRNSPSQITQPPCGSRCPSPDPPCTELWATL